MQSDNEKSADVVERLLAALEKVDQLEKISYEMGATGKGNIGHLVRKQKKYRDFIEDAKRHAKAVMPKVSTRPQSGDHKWEDVHLRVWRRITLNAGG